MYLNLLCSHGRRSPQVIVVSLSSSGGWSHKASGLKNHSSTLSIFLLIHHGSLIWTFSDFAMISLCYEVLKYYFLKSLKIIKKKHYQAHVQCTRGKGSHRWSPRGWFQTFNSLWHCIESSPLTSHDICQVAVASIWYCKITHSGRQQDLKEQHF